MHRHLPQLLLEHPPPFPLGPSPEALSFRLRASRLRQPPFPGERPPSLLRAPCGPGGPSAFVPPPPPTPITPPRDARPFPHPLLKDPSIKF